MRVSPAALALLVGSATAFVPSPPKKALLNKLYVIQEHQKQVELSSAPKLSNGLLVNTPSFPTVSSRDEPSSQSLKSENIKEARRCLSEIEASAEKAREYLDYLNQVAMVVRAYLQDQSPRNFEMPGLDNNKEAREYLTNIEKASANALEYLEYLEKMACGIREYLKQLVQQMEMGIPVNDKQFQQAQEAHLYLKDLEETARAAKEYLAYLKAVADVAQQFLGGDSTLPGIPAGKVPAIAAQMGVNTMAPPLETTTDSLSPRATRVIAKKPTPKVTSTTPIEKSIVQPPVVEESITQPPPSIETTPPVEASMQQPPSATTPPVETSKPEAPITPPPAPPLQVDTAKRIDGERGGSYLESLRSSASTTTPSGGVSSPPSTKTLLKKKTTTSGSYLDSINALTSPTSHFQKGFVDSTPYSEAGPPAKGRSDVSHMDQMEEKTTVPKMDTAPPKTSAPKKAAPSTGSSYLDQVSGAATTTTPRRTESLSAPKKKAAPSTGSYLDEMSGAKAATPRPTESLSASKKPAAGTGTTYLDQMSGAAATTPRPTESLSAPKKPAPSTGSSYLDQMSGAAATTPRPTESLTAPKKPAPSAGSYLDQMAGAAATSPRPTESLSAPKKPALSTGSYLDQMASSSATTPAAKSVSEAAPSARSYLDEMSGSGATTPRPTQSLSASKKAAQSTAGTNAPPASKKAATSTVSNLDQASSSAVATPPPSKSVSEPKKVASSTGSYVDQMASSSATMPSAKSVSEAKEAAPSAGSYFDQKPEETRPAPTKSVSTAEKVTPSTGSFTDEIAIPRSSVSRGQLVPLGQEDEPLVATRREKNGAAPSYARRRIFVEPDKMVDWSSVTGTAEKSLDKASAFPAKRFALEDSLETLYFSKHVVLRPDPHGAVSQATRDPKVVFIQEDGPF